MTSSVLHIWASSRASGSAFGSNDTFNTSTGFFIFAWERQCVWYVKVCVCVCQEFYYFTIQQIRKWFVRLNDALSDVNKHFLIRGLFKLTYITKHNNEPLNVLTNESIMRFGVECVNENLPNASAKSLFRKMT